MPAKIDREYRSLVNFEANDTEDFIVTGYASTFEPYVLFTEDGIDYSEQILPQAFNDTDFSDVIMQYDHEGKVFARTSNNTLSVSVDEHGLKITADLSTTTASRALYEEIKAGLITKMSFAFKVAHDYFNRDTYTRVIDCISKVYDVSAVSLPANPTTEISTRDYFNGVKEVIQAERLEEQRQLQLKKKLELKLKLMNSEV